MEDGGLSQPKISLLMLLLVVHLVTFWLGLTLLMFNTTLAAHYLCLNATREVWLHVSRLIPIALN